MADDTVIDKQTGQPFKVITEKGVDTFAAWLSILYTLAIIVGLSWLLLETWTGKYPDWLSRMLSAEQAKSPIFKLIAYTAIGGAMGAAVNNIRSFVGWHSELNAFGRRFIWKYVSMPPLGAVLAVMVYAIIRGGTAVITGSATDGEGAAVTSLSAWVTGALAGYGSHKVLIWLDDKVNDLFKVDDKIPVPDLTGKTPDEAAKTLKDSKLELGDVKSGPTNNEAEIGKVIGQAPRPRTDTAPGTKVDITIGATGEPNPNGKVAVPDVKGKTQEEAAQILKDVKLELGEVKPERTTDPTLVDKVITQDPAAGTEVALGSKVGITIGQAENG